MYSMDSITGNVVKVDMGPAANLFSNKEQIRRPEGQVDMLIGLHAAALFPTMNNPKHNIVGNLRLLSTKFGTGLLVDGQHPGIVRSRMRILSQALHFRNTAEKGCLKNSKIMNHVTVTKDEEMGKQQSRRSSNRNCSDGVVIPRKTDGQASELINDRLQWRADMPEKPAKDSTFPGKTLRSPDSREFVTDSTSTEVMWTSRPTLRASGTLLTKWSKSSPDVRAVVRKRKPSPAATQEY